MIANVGLQRDISGLFFDFMKECSIEGLYSENLWQIGLLFPFGICLS